MTAVPERVAVVGRGIRRSMRRLRRGGWGRRRYTCFIGAGAEEMSAFGFEYEHAKQEGVRFHWHKQVAAVEGGGGWRGFGCGGWRRRRMGALVPAEGSEFYVCGGDGGAGDWAGYAYGFLAEAGLRLERGRIVIDRASGQTSKAKYFAGGDCTNGGREVVDAVADGKRAGVGIAAWLAGMRSGQDTGKQRRYFMTECRDRME